MTDLTQSGYAVSERIFTLLDEGKEELGVKRVYFGRTDKIPDYPAITVESGPKIRNLERGSTHKFYIELSTEIFIYFGKITYTGEMNEAENEKLTELVETFLHQDFKIGGLVIFGFVTRVEPGTTLRSEEFIKVSRLTWEAQSRQLF